MGWAGVWRLALGAGVGLLSLLPAGAGAVEYLTVAVQPDRAVPAACFSFSAPLPRGKADSFEPFVAVQPAIDHDLQPRGKDLCLTGLRHGNRYTVRLKAGLPAGDGSVLAKDVTVDVTVPDREGRVSFNGDKTILPYRPGVGLPLHSVNVGTARLTVFRFGERGLADQATADWYGQALSGYSVAQVQERASKVFDGTVEIATKPNQDVTTALPIDGLVKGLAPGMYVAVATPGASQPDEEVERATQWFSVSDIGLVTAKTDAGMLVAVRSLATALALPDVELRLIARSNEVLASYKAGPDGRVIVPAGLLRGEGGDAARLLVASLPRGDFTALSIADPAMDLSDLDVAGRKPPGALDAFLWTDRGIYRPGETIHLGTLLRDHNAALPPQTPLILHLERPDGIEVDHFPADLARAGGGTRDIKVPDNAYSGEWTVWAGTGKEHLGEVKVSVQDFVPPRLEAKLDLAGPPPAVGGTIQPTVTADYFYGSPGADLSGNVEATIQAADHPFEAYKDYRFGLVQEPVLPKQLEAQSFTTDEKGRATVALNPEGVLDTAAPLEIVLKATVNDVDGRAADAELTTPLRTGDHFIGLRAVAGESVAENSEAAFDLVWLDGEGKLAGAAPLTWELVLEDYTYNSFFRDGRWQSEEVVNDTRVNGGTVTVGADGHARIAAAVKSGRYRLEAYSADGKAASSLRFGAGWWGTADAAGRKPDVLPVTVDAASPAGTVRARIEPAFAGRVLAMLDGDGLHQVQELDLPKGGGTVTFDSKDVPAAGAYVLAVAIAPSGAVLPRLPVRAVGAGWVAGEASRHRLDVTLAAPDKIVPKTTMTVGVQVTGAPRDQPAYVAVAAVDEAVLGMTDFDTPDPAEHFVGRREPGIEWRDVYSSLIDPDGQPGRLMEGGDARAVKQIGGLDVKTFKTVALFSGPVALDAEGLGSVPLAVPEFSGKLRLMAVAWTVDRFGKAERPVLVRPPLLVELTLPRFLAPGDKAATRVMLTDLEAPEQNYQVTLSTEGPIGFERTDVAFKDVKRDKRRYADRALTATGIGTGKVHMAVKGEDGTVAERDYEIGVRPPAPYVTTRQIRALDPGAKLTAGDALGQDMLPGTAQLDVNIATVPAFDVPGLIAALRRYPYGCAEQTVSRAFPELFVSALGGSAAAPVGNTVTGQGAVARLFSLQAADGSFGYWTAFDTGNLWLTAYVVDYLQHAEKAGLSVPDSMKARALAWLAGRFAAAGSAPPDVAGNAYASVVLARANQLDLSQLRYVSTRDGAALPSDLSRYQLAAALTRAGERDLAARLLRQPPVRRDAKLWLNDYGSALRDRAMALSLAAEEKLLPERTLIERAADLARDAGGTGWLSTQEQAWLVRAAFDLAAKTPLSVQLDGKAVTGRTRAAASIPLGSGRVMDVVNQGQEPVYLSLATTGVPAGTPPAESNGFTVSRSLFTLKGEPVNLADLHQNDEIVAVLEGRMDADTQRKVLLVDLLPAGLEPDTIGLAGSEDAGSFEWLKDRTTPTFQAVRDDRYVAGFDLTADAKTFKVAYTLRAVTPGSYARPGPQVEDMYAPAYHARGEAGTLEVKPARKP